MANFNLVFHDFYCINCGGRNLSLPRSKGKLPEKFHRKKLYCRSCQKEINHVECRNDAEAYEFKEAWALGDFKLEASESLEYCAIGGI